MNFVIDSDVLAKHIAVISKAQSNKNALPILDNILIESNCGKVRLTASDSESYLSCELDAVEYDGNFKIAIDSKKLYNSVKEIGSQPIKIETSNGSEVCIQYLNGKFNLMSADANDYPENTFKSTQNIGLSIDNEMLKNGLGRCAWAVASDELRPQLNGVYVDTCGNTISIIGTDGHKLVKDDCPCADSITGASFIILPRCINILQGMLKDIQTAVTISVAENKSVATFYAEEYTFSCRLIDRTYPNYHSVIPKDMPFKAIIDKANLRGVCSRVLVCASSVANLLKFEFDNNMLTISSKDIDYSTSACEKIECDYNSEPISIGLSGDIIKQLLKELPGELIKISMSSPERAVVFEPETGNDSEVKSLMLMMPMRLQD